MMMKSSTKEKIDIKEFILAFDKDVTKVKDSENEDKLEELSEMISLAKRFINFKIIEKSKKKMTTDDEILEEETK